MITGGALKGRVLALDGLRAVAIVGVLAMHADGALPGGHLGVSVFFVISGYIITQALLAERARCGVVDLFAFYVRRLARLSPPLIVAITVAVAAGMSRGMDFKLAAAAFGSSVLYLTNLVRTFLGNDWLRGFGWTWTLALEEQFYLVWPLLLMVTIRRSWLLSLGVAVAGVVVPAGLRFVLPTLADPVPAQLYYGPHSRVSGLMLGCVVALVLVKRPARLGRRSATVVSVGALAVMTVAFIWARADEASTYTLWLPLIEGASAAAIVAVLAQPGCVPARLLGLRPVAFIGLISYGIYLWNATLLDNMRAVLDLNAATAALWLASTLAVSVASYYWLEDPIRARARAYLKSRSRQSDPQAATGELALDR
jgi:peptidoglycan/LPS O-acetylase OafA/YrhL